MTTLVTVGYTGAGAWPRSRRRVLLDQDTGKHYLVVEVTSPWNERPLTRVYETDVMGSIQSVEAVSEGRPRMVCGGWYHLLDGIGDLTHRLRQGTILSQEESDALDLDLIDHDTENFKRYITPSRQE